MHVPQLLAFPFFPEPAFLVFTPRIFTPESSPQITSPLHLPARNSPPFLPHGSLFQAPKTDAVAAVEQKVVTTELIQKYLNENEQLILAILENQNVGKLQECAQYQARLQQNLMYLAAIADAKPK